VAAAGDLLATPRATDGAHRGPTAWLLDEPEVRAAGLGALAHATELVAGDATDLGLRALQAGLEPRRARMQARLPATVGPAARELRSRCSHPGPAHDALADLELARPAIRTDNPIDEFGDRLARLHRAAWQLVREPRSASPPSPTTPRSASSCTRTPPRCCRHPRAAPAATPATRPPTRCSHACSTAAGHGAGCTSGSTTCAPQPQDLPGSAATCWRCATCFATTSRCIPPAAPPRRLPTGS